MIRKGKLQPNFREILGICARKMRCAAQSKRIYRDSSQPASVDFRIFRGFLITSVVAKCRKSMMMTGAPAPAAQTARHGPSRRGPAPAPPGRASRVGTVSLYAPPVTAVSAAGGPSHGHGDAAGPGPGDLNLGPPVPTNPSLPQWGLGLGTWTVKRQLSSRHGDRDPGRHGAATWAGLSTRVTGPTGRWQRRVTHWQCQLQVDSGPAGPGGHGPAVEAFKLTRKY